MSLLLKCLLLQDNDHGFEDNTEVCIDREAQKGLRLGREVRSHNSVLS